MKLLRKPRQVDEHRAAELIQRGERAEALLRDEIFREALEAVEAKYVTAWRNSSMDEYELRERAHICVCLLTDLKGQLIQYVRDGAIAGKQLEDSLRH